MPETGEAGALAGRLAQGLARDGFVRIGEWRPRETIQVPLRMSQELALERPGAAWSSKVKGQKKPGRGQKTCRGSLEIRPFVTI
jgi:hypothetical protein